MNDRYLFRGKQSDKDKWIYGVPVKGTAKDESEILIIENIFACEEYACRGCEYTPIIPETVGQCTGLKDKNGKLIFEGDVIKTKKYGKETGYSNVNNFDIFKVVYEPAVFRLEAVHRAFNLVGNGDEYEVIGNIHDNPELLEVKE